MKELSIEEKAKRYDEALKTAIVASKDEDRHLKATLERIFPELKEEDENERIRKALITFFQKFPYGSIGEAGTNAKEAISWLEKQGEPKPYVSETMNEKEDFDNGFTRMMEKEQKLADKVEPKFKVGQSIRQGDEVAKIADVSEEGYHCDNAFVPFTAQDSWELVEQKPADAPKQEDIEEYEEVALRDGNSKGITLQFMADGRNISDFRISKSQAEVLVRNMQKWLSKCQWIINEPMDMPVAKSIKNEDSFFNGEINIDAFVSAYMKRHHRMQYRGEIKAYREGLVDMYNKLRDNNTKKG